MILKNFRKYEKTFRILMPNIDIIGKRYLTPDQERILLKYIVQITEKIDGGIVGIYKDFKGNVYLQKKGSALDFSHAQYIYFQDWVKTNHNIIHKLPCGKVYYAELMRCEHSIFYDKLTNFVIFFDIFDLKEERYHTYNYMATLCKIHGLECVPLVYEGFIKNKKQLGALIPKESKFGSFAEGIVIKNNFNQTRGKIVKDDFIKLMNEHWRKKSVKFNKTIDNKMYLK